jgi:hypothetical protein
VQFGGSDPGTVAFDAVVNAAGLGAQALAHRIEGYPADKVPRLVLAKGNYFGFAGRPVFSRLIYPTPGFGALKKTSARPKAHSPITPQMMRSPAFPAGSLV